MINVVEEHISRTVKKLKKYCSIILRSKYDKTIIDRKFQKTEMEYEEWNQDSFGDNYKNFFSNNVLNNSYCLKNYIIII